MKMPALNVIGIEIYFGIPKYFLYMLKESRHGRKKWIWDYKKRKKYILVSHHGQLKEEIVRKKLGKKKKLDIDKRRLKK